MRDIQRVLECWGGWASQEGTHLEWMSVAAGFKGLWSMTPRTRLSCCDTDGMLIDAAVGMLKKSGRNKEFEVIMLHYRYHVSKSTLARWEKCSEGKVRNRLMLAETFIDACIIMSGATLELEYLLRESEKKPE